MRTIFCERQMLHAPLAELNRGVMGPPFENPERARYLIDAIRAAQHPVEAPGDFPLDPVLRVHDASYVAFLEGVHAEWLADGRAGDALPLAFAIRGFRSDRIPQSLDGRLSYYAFEISSPIGPGTWNAARAATDVALTGARLIAGGQERAVLSLCRPPGHHAGADYYGGYCFLNNAAIAAQYLRDAGAGRVAILDVDYHHGNGTQHIFEARDDVLYVSLHGDPAHDFPFFLGHADEKGTGAGEGFTLNYPLPRGIGWAEYREVLADALAEVARFAPDALVVSLGLDTYGEDPISHFRFTTEDFVRLGQAIAAQGLPTLLVFEGGYATAALGTNLIAFLDGYEGRR